MKAARMPPTCYLGRVQMANAMASAAEMTLA
jgi:hypothetical protein